MSLHDATDQHAIARGRAPGGARDALGAIVRTGVRRPVLLVSAAIATLAILAGAILFVQVGDQTAREGDDQLARHVVEQSERIEGLYVQAQRDIRLARRNSVLEEVMAKPVAQVTTTDRGSLDSALIYLGELRGG